MAVHGSDNELIALVWNMYGLRRQEKAATPEKRKNRVTTECLNRRHTTPSSSDSVLQRGREALHGDART